MTAEVLAQHLLVGIRIGAQIDVERYQDAGRAEATLQRMVAPERLLQDRKPAELRRQGLDGAQRRAIDLHREREACACRRAVDLDRAGAADAVLAADMDAGH